MQYSKNEDFKYLVIEASHGDYYGFNTKVKKEREIATKIVTEYDDFMVKGWKVSKKLPVWVLSADSWTSFNNGKDVDDMEAIEAKDAYKGVKGGHLKEGHDDKECNQGTNEAIDDEEDDDEEEEEDPLGEKLSTLSTEDFEQINDSNNDNLNATTKSFLRAISTTCKAMGHTEQAAKHARRRCFAMLDFFGLNSLFMSTTPDDEYSFRVRLYCKPKYWVSCFGGIFLNGIVRLFGNLTWTNHSSHLPN